jgi:hypothetical protein
MQAPVILAELILPILLGTTRAPTTPIDRDHTTTVELSIVEDGRGRPVRTEVELAEQGKAELWVAEGEARRFCEIETSRNGDRDELFVALRCRATTNGPDELRVQARGTVKKGGKMTIAKLKRADGRSLEVTAKLR